MFQKIEKQNNVYQCVTKYYYLKASDQIRLNSTDIRIQRDSLVWVQYQL